MNPLNNISDVFHDSVKSKMQNGLELMILEETVQVKVEDKKVDLVENDKIIFSVLNEIIDKKIDMNVEKKMVEESSQEEQYLESQSVYNPSSLDKRMNVPIGNGKKRGPYKKFSQSEKQNLVS